MNKLIYVDKIGQNIEGNYEYDLYFAENLITNRDWSYDTCGLQEPIKPKRYDIIKKLVMNIPLLCLQDNMCFGMLHGVDGIVALAYEDISDYDEYPSDGRLVFSYGMYEQDVRDMLDNRGIIME